MSGVVDLPIHRVAHVTNEALEVPEDEGRVFWEHEIVRFIIVHDVEGESFLLMIHPELRTREITSGKAIRWSVAALTGLLLEVGIKIEHIKGERSDEWFKQLMREVESDKSRWVRELEVKGMKGKQLEEGLRLYNPNTEKDKALILTFNNATETVDRMAIASDGEDDLSKTAIARALLHIGKTKKVKVARQKPPGERGRDRVTTYSRQQTKVVEVIIDDGSEIHEVLEDASGRLEEAALDVSSTLEGGD